ncbi:MAG: hypothetical protein LBK61_05340 [Spirochaetaceae bacterium]|nr:hypothetical protein [Spirochaetaceae bacterium]
MYTPQGVPLRGANTQPGFHPFANLSPLESYPNSGRESAAGRQSTPLRRLCFPFGRAMPP